MIVCVDPGPSEVLGMRFRIYQRIGLHFALRVFFVGCFCSVWVVILIVLQELFRFNCAIIHIHSKIGER